MRSTRHFVWGGIGFLAVVTAALARDEAANPHWLPKAEIEGLVQTEPPPPVPDSPADQADLQAVLTAQSDRTPATVSEAETDAPYSVALFVAAMGPGVTPANDPVTFHFFDRFNRQVGEIVGDLKGEWKRPRPFEKYPQVHALFGVSGYSYPSGHATLSYAFAVMLGQLFPDRAALFLHRAHLIAQSRVDAGVHYPTDIREGERVGRQITKELLANPQFMAELNAARAELTAKK